MTVKYVQSLHQNRLREQNSTANESNNFNEFISGFTECAKSVEQFLCESSSVNPNVMTSLSTHLNHCMQTLRSDLNSHRVIPNTLQCSSTFHPFSSSPSLSQQSSLSFTSETVHHLPYKDVFTPFSDNSDDKPLNLSLHRVFGDLVHEVDDMWRPW